MPKAHKFGSVVTKRTTVPPLDPKRFLTALVRFSRQTHVYVCMCTRTCTCEWAGCMCLYIALIIERIDNRRVGSFRVACVNADPKTGEPNPQASREIASMQLS